MACFRAPNGTCVPYDKCAVVVVGMWDSHACLVAQEQLNTLAPRVRVFLEFANRVAMHVMWGTSSMPELLVPEMRAPIVTCPRAPLEDHGTCFPPYPLRDEDTWTVAPSLTFARSKVGLHPAVRGAIVAGNHMSVKLDKEIANYVLTHEIGAVFYVGAHLNKCIVDRPYGLRNTLRWIPDRCFVIGDLVVAEHKDPVWGTEMMLDYIAKHFCPVVASARVEGSQQSSK